MQWFIKIRYKQINLYQVCLVGFVKTNSTRGGVWTHEDISPLDLKSTALTTRPFWSQKQQTISVIFML